MSSRTSPPPSDALRPIDAREIGAKLQDLVAAVAETVGASRSGPPRPLSTKALLACLAPLTSRN